ncbi:hypothetical protein CORT_0E02050 [Candida orthopsilosis Co 90-125]|uniref:Uncharacterized protein n=1 Tax=Candida orthopsilosis (strain 90-125) TaxID=1136231 RepID=H8X7K9_CANO9|nr:hypothetical protein CORT_0E02050 [Candida orthopsilosis Co 90-125]CCG23793.1 hypothetical protein CORT_0E02050 [Candida orthopsilosis Co 90-125]
MEIFLLTAGVVLTVAACENRYSRTRSSYDDDYDLGSSSSYHQRSHNHCYRCNQKTSCRKQTATSGLSSVPGLGISAGQQVAPRVGSTSTRTSGLSSSKGSKTINKSLQTKSKTQSAPKPEIVSQQMPKAVPRSNSKDKVSTKPSSGTLKLDKSSSQRKLSFSNLFKRSQRGFADRSKKQHLQDERCIDSSKDARIFLGDNKSPISTESMPLFPPTFHESTAQLTGKNECLPEYSFVPPPRYEDKEE